MSTVQSLDTAIAWLQGSVGQPASERLAYIDNVRQVLLRARHDPLAEAEITLLEAMVPNTDRPVQQIVDALERALKVFDVNDRLDRVAMCWRLLASWQKMRGATAESLACAHRALGMPELRLQSRLALVNSVLPGLSALMCFDDAWASLERDFLPFMLSAPPSRQLALAWTDVAYHHVTRAMRRGRLRSLFTLDLDDTAAACSPAMRELMAPELLRAEHCLARAVAVSEPVAKPAITLTRGLIHALNGRFDDAVRDFGLQPAIGLVEATRLQNIGWAARINGRWQEALGSLQPGLALAQRLDLAILERACLHEIAWCSEALGDLPAFGAAQSRFILLQARMAMHGPRLSAQADAWRAARPASGQAARAGASASASQKSQWRRAMPPHVKRAMALISQTIGQRLDLATMAERVGVRPRTLQASLRQYHGMTFVAAYRSAAMTEANRLLQWSQTPISEIAAQVGYRSATSFTRDYKAVYGITPSTFRAGSA